MKISRSAVVLLATLVGVGTTVSMGRWQLSRAQTKLDLFAAMQSRERMPPLSNAQLACDAAPWQGDLQRLVRLRGRWLSEHTIFLDNRAMDGRAGRFVLTPLRLEADAGTSCPDRVVLVQRGWVPRDAADRTLLPNVNSGTGIVTVPGRVSEAPSHLMELGAAASAPAGKIRQNVDLAALAAEWQVVLRPGSITQLDDEEPNAPQDLPLVRHWWKPQADVSKHEAYAAQWFTMAAVMVGLYLWFQWWRPRRAQPE